MKQKILDRLKDLPRHRAALQEGMAVFGEDFELAAFERASNSSDPPMLNQAKVVERGLDQIFNYIAELNAFGLELAGVRDRAEEPNSRLDLDRLREARVLSGNRVQELQTVRELRRQMVHEYPQIRPQQVHEAVRLLDGVLPLYVRAYRGWLRAGFPSDMSSSGP